MTTLIMAADKIGFASASAWFKKLAEKMHREAVARKTIKELSALSNKELNDIGISRGEIYDIAYNGVNR